MSTATNGAQPKGSFTDRYGAHGEKDDLAEWGDDTAKALRDAGFGIVRFGPVGMLYVGQLNAQKHPHGQGYLYQPGGERHEGLFENGRAHGEGVFLAAGKEYKGSWVQNKRVGVFLVSDAKGLKWRETYNEDGSRKSRVKVRENVPNPKYTEGAVDEDGEPVPETIKVLVEPDEAATKCWNCNNDSRERNNHAWACRAHKGRWSEATDYRGSGEAPGVWACCGKENANEPGCSFDCCSFRK